MGQGSVKTLDAGVVDETFEGLTKPHEVHAMGRPDIAEGRPGDVLVEAVRRFADAGWRRSTGILAMAPPRPKRWLRPSPQATPPPGKPARSMRNFWAGCCTIWH